MASIGAKGFRNLGSGAFFLGARRSGGGWIRVPGEKHMTEERKLKQIIRARAAKTGERYTTARMHVLAARAGKEHLAAAVTPAATPPMAGLGDKAVLAKTGHGFDHWFAVLDAFEAGDKGHTAAARHLRDDHGVPGWHSQGITVAYERARGLRAVNQAAGGFQVTVTRAVPAALETVIAAFRPEARRRWLAGADPGLRRSLESALPPRGKGIVRGPKRSRVRYKWDGASVELVLEPRANGASVAVSITRMRDAAQVAERRGQWRVVLDALKAHIGNRA
jgi:hypothetical protein